MPRLVMGPRLRKVMLAIHLTTSVGWMGAILAYFVLDLSASLTTDPQTSRWNWLAMGLVVSRAIVPLAIAAVITGLIQALGSPWGLIRHWWVLISLLLTLFAAFILLGEAGGIARMAELAADPGIADSAFPTTRGTLPHSVGGFVVLAIVQVLNVVKPRGLTPYGWRREQEERHRREVRRVASTKEAL